MSFRFGSLIAATTAAVLISACENVTAPTGAAVSACHVMGAVGSIEAIHASQLAASPSTWSTTLLTSS